MKKGHAMPKPKCTGAMPPKNPMPHPKMHSGMMKGSKKGGK